MYLVGLPTKAVGFGEVHISLASGAPGGVLNYCHGLSTMHLCFDPELF
jgi:hypothetical protein